ncbi:MAG: ABC transporter permease [Bacillota bacterium]
MNSILIALNIIKRLLKEISALGFIFIFPILAAVLATLMFGSPKVSDIGIACLSHNDYGLASYLEQNKNYNVIDIDTENIEKMVNSKQIDIGIILPEGLFGEDKVKLICIKDGQTVQELRGTIDAYLGAVITNSPPPKAALQDNSNEAILQSKAAIGMISMFILMFIGIGMQLLLEDKRLKTFMRAFCAPLRDYEMTLAQLLANFLLGTLQIIIFLIFAAGIFKFDFGTSLVNVFLLLELFLITAIGLCVGIVGFVNDGTKYNMIITIVAVTMSFLGGCFFPLDFMNEFLKKLANITPQKWMLDAYMKLAEGRGLLEVQTELLVVFLFGLVLFTFGIKTLRPSPEDM